MRMREFFENCIVYGVGLLIVISFIYILFKGMEYLDKKEKQRIQNIMKEYKYLKPQKVKVCVSRGVKICNVYFEYSYDEFLKNKDILEMIRKEDAL